MKAIRNNIFRSKQNGTRNLKLQNIHFGWKDVEAVYTRDENRASNGEYRRTDVVKQSICLDSFTMMNTAYAKHLFASKTIPEVISYISVQVNVKIDLGKEFNSEYENFYDCTTILSKKINQKQTVDITSQFAL